jgi:hypothetical protein
MFVRRLVFSVVLLLVSLSASQAQKADRKPGPQPTQQKVRLKIFRG